MVEVYTVIGFLVGIFFISFSLIKLKKQTTSQDVFALWTIIGIIIIITSSVPNGIFIIQELVGTEFVLSAVFGVPLVILTILVFFLHVKVDSLNTNIVKLVAQLGVKEFFESSEKKEKGNDSKE